MNAGTQGAEPQQAHFPGLLAKWLAQHAPLISAVALLRRGDTESAEMEALLESRPLKTLSLAWDIWVDLNPCCPADADRQLRTVLPIETIDECRFALWGTEPPAERADIHIVQWE